MKPRSSKISVIIPNWNGKTHLSVCLNALDHQIFSDFEVILVDAASQDGTSEAVMELASGDSRFI